MCVCWSLIYSKQSHKARIVKCLSAFFVISGHGYQLLRICLRQISQQFGANDGPLQLLCSRILLCQAATGCFASSFIYYLYLCFRKLDCGFFYYVFICLWQTAIRMYKLVGEERFLLWAVCSIQLQVTPICSALCFLCMDFRSYFVILFFFLLAASC